MYRRATGAEEKQSYVYKLLHAAATQRHGFIRLGGPEAGLVEATFR